jgi:predicted AlkP superfamily phosphohydrolase/phosphomutase
VRAKLGLAQDEPWHRLDTWKSPLTNFAKSRAFGGHQYEHAVYINVAGRGATGIVQRGAEYDAVCTEVVDLLRRTTDPRTGEHVFEAVFTAAEVYQGEYLAGAPGYLVSSGVGLAAGLDGGFLRDARDGDVTGYHLPDGVFIGHGPAFRRTSEVNATLLDVTPTVLALMGVGAPESLDGRVIDEAIHADAVAHDRTHTAETAATREASTDAVYSAEEEMEITRRLADLGYL